MPVQKPNISLTDIFGQTDRLYGTLTCVQHVSKESATHWGLDPVVSKSPAECSATGLCTEKSCLDRWTEPFSFLEKLSKPFFSFPEGDMAKRRCFQVHGMVTVW